MQDTDGQTALQALLGRKNINRNQISFELVQCLTSPSNIDIQDQHGNTALHYLAARIRDFAPETSLKLLDCLISDSNIEMQNENGHVALHFLVEAMFYDTELGHRILTTFPSLITEKNVNLADTCGITPYSWLLLGKKAWQNYQSTIKMLSEVEEIFHKNGVDVDSARNGFIPAL